MINSAKHELRVALVEDCRDTRETLAFIINSDPRMTCVAQASCAREAVELLPAARPDLVLLDIQLGERVTGADLLQSLRILLPNTKIIMLTVLHDPPTIARCLMRGASGYLLKNTPAEQIPDAILEAAQGGAPLSPEVARITLGLFQSVGQSGQEWEKLSPRQQEVLELMTRGLVKKEIAGRLGISEETVRTHCANIYEKLHVSRREDAIAKAAPPIARWWMKE